MLMGFNEWRGCWRGGGGSIGEIFKWKNARRNFYFLTRVFREHFDIAFGINLFLTKLLEGVGKVV